MNAIDYLLLVILLVSVVLGFYRGFLRESIALLSWLGGLWLAWHYACLVVPHLEGVLRQSPWNIWAGRLFIFVALLMLGWLISAIVNHFVHQSSLSLTLDRTLGVLFGAIRGLVVIAIMVMLGLQVQLERSPWWKASKFMPIAVQVSGWVKGFADSAINTQELQSEEAIEA